MLNGLHTWYTELGSDSQLFNPYRSTGRQSSVLSHSACLRFSPPTIVHVPVKTAYIYLISAHLYNCQFNQYWNASFNQSLHFIIPSLIRSGCRQSVTQTTIPVLSSYDHDQWCSSLRDKVLISWTPRVPFAQSWYLEPRSLSWGCNLQVFVLDLVLRKIIMYWSGLWENVLKLFTSSKISECAYEMRNIECALCLFTEIMLPCIMWMWIMSRCKYSDKCQHLTCPYIAICEISSSKSNLQKNVLCDCSCLGHCLLCTICYI